MNDPSAFLGRMKRLADDELKPFLEEFEQIIGRMTVFELIQYLEEHPENTQFL